MGRLPFRLASILFAVGSVVLFRGSSCSVSLCIEDCDPCVTLCKCHHTCRHANLVGFEESHRLVAFELLESRAPDGSARRVCAWIDGLSVARATGRSEFGARELREFAEGVVGVNHELLDLEPELGHWEFGGVELAGEFELVHFGRVGAGKRAAEGALDFLFDARGKLLEIERAVPGN